MTAPTCDQCSGQLYPVDIFTGHTVCVECVRRSLDRAITLRNRGQAIASAAHPTERTAVESAIRQLAATGRPFSANDARQIHGVKGGVVGAAFTAMNKAGVIKAVGDETSTDPGTHGHRVYLWQGSDAA
jgi:hypothetical protein